jgi:hypothetical protein
LGDSDAPSRASSPVGRVVAPRDGGADRGKREREMPDVVAASTAPASTSPPASSSQHHHAQGLLCHAVAGASAGNVAFEFLPFLVKWSYSRTLEVYVK